MLEVESIKNKNIIFVSFIASRSETVSKRAKLMRILILIEFISCHLLSSTKMTRIDKYFKQDVSLVVKNIVQTPLIEDPRLPTSSPPAIGKSSKTEKSIDLSSSSDCSLNQQLFSRITGNSFTGNGSEAGTASQTGAKEVVRSSAGSRILPGGMEWSRDSDGFAYFLIPAAQTTADLLATGCARSGSFN
jgi:hypothetical protein